MFTSAIFFIQCELIFHFSKTFTCQRCNFKCLSQKYKPHAKWTAALPQMSNVFVQYNAVKVMNQKVKKELNFCDFTEIEINCNHVPYVEGKTKACCHTYLFVCGFTASQVNQLLLLVAEDLSIIFN